MINKKKLETSVYLVLDNMGYIVKGGRIPQKIKTLSPTIFFLADTNRLLGHCETHLLLAAVALALEGGAWEDPREMLEAQQAYARAVVRRE